MAIRDFLLAACLVAVAVPGANGADLAYAQNYLSGSMQIVAFPVSDPSAMVTMGPQADTPHGLPQHMLPHLHGRFRSIAFNVG